MTDKERQFQALVAELGKSTPRLEIERSAAYQAGSRGIEWDDLPEQAGVLFWRPSKEKFRRAALEGMAQLKLINRRFDRAYTMSQAVKLPKQ